MRDVTDSQLFRRLKGASDELYGRALEVRRSAASWLEYIPATFPHYTRHTVAHSDNIIFQLSELVYGEPHKDGTVTLSGIEMYVLIVAAYLHDAGMVVSDSDKARLMESDDWEAFVAPGGAGHERWLALKELRRAKSETSDVALFTADVQLRFLIAELVRRHHHLRTAEILVEHERFLGDFAFGDGVLRGTIAAVCAGHGLSIPEIESSSDYPTRRLVLNEPVNVLFLTILLRIGDLLDMSADRACPLLLNAASPLPSDSYAHWSQYACITHQLTAPDRIELTAACNNQQEHRFLADWTSWLVQELSDARAVMARAERHSEWVAPHAIQDGPQSTINIRPGPDASYVPKEWKLVLDERAVVERLVKDTYTERLAFLRELLRNAADATRCRLYAEAAREGGPLPDSPTEMPDSLLQKFPIRIELVQREVPNPMADKTEARWLLRVVDHGIGMTDERIRKYFLQVGQSFYRSPEFRQQYVFEPGSRFGVGFLSVFGESTDVAVETLADEPGAVPIKMRLSGVRNYLLTEQGSRTQAGTEVELELSEALDPAVLIKTVREWCRFLEVPVDIRTPSRDVRVSRERSRDYEKVVPVVGDPGATLGVRAFPTGIDGIDGALYVFEHRDAAGRADWARENWARYGYLDRQPGAVVPSCPSSVTAFQGIASDGSVTFRPEFRGGTARIDVRTVIPDMPLTREPGQASRSAVENKLTRRWSELLTEHVASTPLADGDTGWHYKQRLMDYFPRVKQFWIDMAATVPYWQEGNRLGSLAELETATEIASAMTIADLERGSGDRKFAPIDIEWPYDAPSLAPNAVGRISDVSRVALFARRVVVELRRSGSVIVGLWRVQEPAPWAARGVYGAQRADGIAMGRDGLVGFAFHQTGESTYSRCVLNTDHPFVEWWIAALEACDAGLYGLGREHGDRLHGLLMTPVTHGGYQVDELNQYVTRWSSLPGLGSDLLPPPAPLSRTSFDARRLVDL